jgi:PAS domain S-box-containing protein
MQRPQPTQKRYQLNENDFIVSKTDTSGKITYGNKSFIELSKYSEEELLGAPHSIIRHPDMPKSVFKLLWSRIQKGEEIFAFVKNLSKDGSYYWVFTNVTASQDHKGKNIGYFSVRRKPNEAALQTVIALYKTLIEAEKAGGVDAGVTKLNTILNEKGVSYDELIISLQQ